MLNIDARDRILTLIDILFEEKVSVKEIQQQFYHIHGIVPDRKTIYKDLQAIEKYYPLRVSNNNQNGVPKYSL